MQSTGKFLTIEGGEGVGKSTFSKTLLKRLQSSGLEVTATREPGGTVLADQIRSLFLSPPENEPIYPETEIFLVSAARSQHVRKLIQPSLEAGQWVLCDRFYDSSRVYQGFLGGLHQQAIEACISLSVRNCHPDVSFLLDCDVDIILDRLAKRASENSSKESKQSNSPENEEENRFDLKGKAFHQKLREGFLAIAKQEPKRMKIIDANQTPEAMVHQALEHLKNLKFL